MRSLSESLNTLNKPKSARLKLLLLLATSREWDRLQVLTFLPLFISAERSLGPISQAVAVVSRDLNKLENSRVEAKQPSMMMVDVGNANRAQTAISHPRLVRCLYRLFHPINSKS